MARPSWNKYFLYMCKLVAMRSTCTRRAVGAVIVRDNHVLSTGYNGTPKGIEHCTENSCIRTFNNIPSGERHEFCMGLHAEQNAIIQASCEGVNIKGSTMYCTTKPCIICTKMIINAGIETVYYIEDYKDELTDKIISMSNTKFEKVKEDGITLLDIQE